MEPLRKELAEGVFLTYVPAAKFKTGVLGAQLITPLEENTVAAGALLPAVLLESYVESLSAVSWAVGVLLLVNGAILFLSDKLSSGRESLDTAGPGKALLVGVVQMVAIFPGISRSGSMFTGVLVAGFRREDAVRFSFLLSIPAILGANLLKLPDLFETGLGGESALPMLLGVAAALLSGIAAIRLLRYITKNKSFTPFSIYCALAGAAVIAADLLR